MILLSNILHIYSDCLIGKKVKLVRHKDSRQEYRHVMHDRETLLEYQKEQNKDVFKGCDYIVSFVGLDRKRSVFIGVFEVLGSNPTDGKMNYNLQAVSEFEGLVDRLIIDWGNNAISWHQWFDKQDKEVIEILPKGYIGSFPGLTEFFLSFDELEKLINNPDGNRDWFHHLTSVNAVYLILDSRTGEQYIGSAYGADGLWGRWSNYARTKHGDNKKLKDLIKQIPDAYKSFRYSILQTLPSNLTPNEVIKIENLYKEKMGSRVHGLNNN